jgi:hypothetical protein
MIKVTPSYEQLSRGKPTFRASLENPNHEGTKDAKKNYLTQSRKDANAGDRRELNHEDTKNTKKDCLTQRRKDANARDRRELNHEGAKQKKQKIRQD